MPPDDSNGEPEQNPYYAFRADWDAVLEQCAEDCRDLRNRLDAILAADSAARNRFKPIDLAVQVGRLSTNLFDAIAPGERDLRQMITTLRTGLALCWDMYSATEAAKTSVEQHMYRLQRDIDSFEADLATMSEQRAPSDT